MWETIIILDDS